MRTLTGGLWVAAAALCVSGGVAMGADKGLTDASFVKRERLGCGDSHGAL